jgi:hypothetical protein
MEQPKVIVLTCVHSRRETVRKCLRLNNIETVVVYSNTGDLEVLKSEGVKHIYHHANLPLSKKWNYGVQMLRDIDFDHVIFMGSDDYFNQSFLDFVKREAPKYDLLAFKDLFFEEEGKFYYWAGYKGQREGEPAGAGKVYSKKFLEAINYNLFPRDINKGLDSLSWAIAKKYTKKIKVEGLAANGLFLCDVKDGEGITPLSKIKDLIVL